MATLDIEPTWETICNMVENNLASAKELLPACKIADVVRQAQKNGKQSVTFKFDKEKNDIKIEVESD